MSINHCYVTKTFTSRGARKRGETLPFTVAIMHPNNLCAREFRRARVKYIPAVTALGGKHVYEDIFDLPKSEQFRLFQAIKDTLFPEPKERQNGW
jgi:hypothetical protein